MTCGYWELINIDVDILNDIQQLFETERFPNVLVAKDGSVIATFGGVSRPDQGRLKVRRSTDGGETWGDLQILHEPIQWHGGGKSWPVSRLVDEGNFAYSSLAAGRPGTASEGMIYLLYEGQSGANIARFNLAWILEGRDGCTGIYRVYLIFSFSPR